MIATAPKLVANSAPVREVRKPVDDAHLLERLQSAAGEEMDRAFRGVSQKEVDAVGLDGFRRGGFTRAVNGDATNPLFRIVGLFVLMRRLGLGRAGALRMLEWLRAAVDLVWPPEEEPTLEEALEKDQALDPRDELARYRTSKGDEESTRVFLDAALDHAAHRRVLIPMLFRRLVVGPQL